MWKFIKKWRDDYHAVNQYMADQGIHIYHTPFGIVHYVDERAIQRLNNNDRSNSV